MKQTLATCIKKGFITADRTMSPALDSNYYKHCLRNNQTNIRITPSRKYSSIRFDLCATGKKIPQTDDLMFDETKEMLQSYGLDIEDRVYSMFTRIPNAIASEVAKKLFKIGNRCIDRHFAAMVQILPTERETS